MTKTLVKNAMAKKNIKGELRGKGADWEVELPNETQMRRFQRNVIRVGGYRTGSGAWVLRPNYQSKGDWNDKTSAWHY